VPIVLKSRSLKLLEHSGPPQACNGIVLPLTSSLGLSSTQRQARELISNPSPSANNRRLPFNRAQSRVSGLLTGHNTVRRHLHLMGLTNSPLCRRCRAQDETSAHILCECEALASLRHAHELLFLQPRGH
jgi:hypothetical protein